MSTSTRTVTVAAGPYATVRATERARRLYGPAVVVRGIIGPTWGRTYTFEVVDNDEPTE